MSNIFCYERKNKTMEKQTNQSSLERDQPTDLNLCPCCAGKGKIVSNPEQNEHSVVCKCGHKISVYNPTLNEWQLTVLKSLWNMSLVQMELSQKTKDALNLTDNSLLAFDISNYTLLKSFNTFLDAITFMEQRFNKDMSRSILFQLRENRLEYIMVSDELWEDLTD